MKLLTGLGALTTVGIAAGLAGYVRFIRPGQLRWGATDEEVARAMPLDSDIQDPALTSTRAVTIRARPDEIWLWLAQIGESPRAGYYSYEWIERLMGMKVENSNVILSQYQHPKPGDRLDRAGYMTVRSVEPGRSLVLGPPPDDKLWLQCTWSFALYPEDPETTRLVTRVRAKVRRWAPLSVLWTAVLDPGAFVMERKMLLEIKRRAENMAEERRAHVHVFEEVLLEAMKSA